jgi:flavin reductase (DIM6/NTAB) family NADH-FMN oxidoreductase RutF
MKEIIPLKESGSLISHGAVVLVTSSFREKSNIISVSSQMPVTMKPLSIAISIGKERLSHSLIEKSGEFAVNIPSWDFLEQVIFCGSNSGNKMDKFKESKLTPINAIKIHTPLIEECIANFECKLVHQFDVSDHTIFVGEVLLVQAAKDVIKNGMLDIGNFKTIHQLDYNSYVTLTLH